MRCRAIGAIIRKLPIQEAVEWQKFLSKKSKADQNKPFPSFLNWLEEAGSSWELLAASGTGTKGKSGGVQVHHTFFGDEELETGQNARKCYKCDQEGHIKQNFSNKAINVNVGGAQSGKGKSNASSQQLKKERGPLKCKKFHCAYHRDIPGRYCSTWSCPSLKYIQ